MSTEIKNIIKWKDANYTWGTSLGDALYKEHTGRFEYTWDEVFLVQSLALGGGIPLDQTLEKLNDKDKKKVIRLVMRMNGIKKYDETKEVKNIKTKVKDVELIIKEIRSSIKIVI